MLGNQLILNGIINFTLIAFTASQAATTFLVRPDVTIPLPAGPVTFSVDSQDIFPKYSVIHLINYKASKLNSSLQLIFGLRRHEIGTPYHRRLNGHLVFVVLGQVGSKCFSPKFQELRFWYSQVVFLHVCMLMLLFLINYAIIVHILPNLPYFNKRKLEKKLKPIQPLT